MTLQEDLTSASQRAEASLAWTRQLLEDGFPSPALVWAVRSVEIFLKEFVLAAVFAQEDSALSWDQAVRKSSKLFEKIKWRNAFRKMTEAFGPLDPMTTADGRDVLDVWGKGDRPDAPQHRPRSSGGDP